jgi:hypothetical protein
VDEREKTCDKRVGFAKNFAGFLLGLLVAVLARRALVPPVPGPLEKEALPVLAERASCNVLFLGPSYVASQVHLETFNREAERIGSRARACKFGASALRGYELRMWFERFLAEDWPNLEIVVIDITLGDGIDFEPANWFKPRVVEWHTWKAMPWLLDYYEYRERLPLAKRIPALWTHTKHLGAHYVELGQGVSALRELRLLERFRQKDAKPSSDAKRVSARERAERVSARVPVLRRQIKRLTALRRARGPRGGDSGWALELQSVARAGGKKAYFLIAPVLYSPIVPQRGGRGPRQDRLVVFDYNDPDRYPELYRVEVRGNTSHLRTSGSAIYSRLLAHDIARLEQKPRRR